MNAHARAHATGDGAASTLERGLRELLAHPDPEVALLAAAFLAPEHSSASRTWGTREGSDDANTPSRE